MARVTILVLGGFSVFIDGRPALAFESDKARALVSYLAVESARPHRREALAGLLWPDQPDAVALRSLRQALFNVRQVLGDGAASVPLLSVSRDSIALNRAGDYWLDAESFALLGATPTSASAVDRLEEAVGLYRGPFLDGLSRADSEPFEEWVLARREQYHRQAGETLQRLTALYAGQSQYEPALKHAWRILELDPWREEGHQQVMRLLAASGQRSAALAQYQTCRRVLADELGAEPAPETAALYERIRRGAPEAATAVIVAGVQPASPAFLLSDSEPIQRETPIFVDREGELRRLEHFLDLAFQGQGSVAFVTGGPGSGKTMLMRKLAHQAMERHPDLLVTFGAGNAYTGAGDPYHTFLETLQMLAGDVEARWAGGAISRQHALRLWHALPLTTQILLDEGRALLGRFVDGGNLLRRAQAFAPTGADWVTELRSVVQQQAARPQSEMAQADLCEQVVRVLQALARRQPLLLMLDDLQWLDAGSINLLFHLGRQLHGNRILVLGAYRPADVALGRAGERHPLEPLAYEIGLAFGDVEVDLSQAQGRHFVEALLDREPNRLGAEFREALYHHTEGHALFTVELLRSLRENGDLVRDATGSWLETPALDWMRLPARVESVIGEHIGRLGEDGRKTLEAACVQGEEFTAEVVAGVLGEDEDKTIGRLSGDVCRRHKLVLAQSVERLEGKQISRYRFRHYLFQRYLYGRLDAVERALLHGSTGRVLEALHGEGADELAVSLARHFELAGVSEKAVHYLLEAGQRAGRLSAYNEAATHMSHGLELLDGVPHGPIKLRLEFDLQAALGMTLQRARGYTFPPAEQALARARDLCAELGDPPELFGVLCAQIMLHRNQGRLDASRQEAELLLQQAEPAGNLEQIMVCHSLIGAAAYFMGDLEAARQHLVLQPYFTR